MIYFIQNGKNGSIKIGYTKNKKSLESRIKTMQIGTPDELILIGTIIGNKKDEYDLHKKFHVCQIHGEWFNPDPNLLNFVSNVCKTNSFFCNYNNAELLKTKSLDMIITDIEINFINYALRQTKTKEDAARILKIDTRSLRYKIDKYKKYLN